MFECQGGGFMLACIILFPLPFCVPLYKNRKQVVTNSLPEQLMCLFLVSNEKFFEVQSWKGTCLLLSGTHRRQRWGGKWIDTAAAADGGMREEDREGEQHFDDNTNGPKLSLRTSASFSQRSLAHVKLQVITNGHLFKFYMDLVKYYVGIYIII